VFKRLFWLVIGFGSGLGTSWYVFRSVKRTVRRTVEMYAPAELAARAGDGWHTMRVNLRAAWIEGRVAMCEREAELRSRLDRGPRPAPAPATAPAPDPAPTRAPVAAPVDDELAARRNRVASAPTGRARIGR
jgi:hypothetical protein